jgi:hypothetical protein
MVISIVESPFALLRDLSRKLADVHAAVPPN